MKLKEPTISVPTWDDVFTGCMLEELIELLSAIRNEDKAHVLMDSPLLMQEILEHYILNIIKPNF